MKGFFQVLGISGFRIDIICLFVPDFQFVSIFSVIRDYVWYYAIFKALYHIFFTFIAFVCHGLYNPFGFFPDSFKCGIQQSMICHLIGHLEISYEMCFWIDCGLRIISHHKAVFAFHQLCVGISQGHLGLPVFFHDLLISLILFKAFPCFLQLLFNNLSRQPLRIVLKILLPVSIIQYPQVFLNMSVQPLNPVIQFIFCEVVILWITCCKLAAVYRSKSPLHSSGKPLIKLIENLFEAVYVILSEIRYRSEIRLHSAKHPFYFHIYPATFSQLSWRLDSVIASIDIQFKKPLRVVWRSALRCQFLHSIIRKIKTVYKSIYKPRRTFWIHHGIPCSHHKLVSIKSLYIMHHNYLKM